MSEPTRYAPTRTPKGSRPAKYGEFVRYDDYARDVAALTAQLEAAQRERDEARDTIDTMTRQASDSMVMAMIEADRHVLREKLTAAQAEATELPRLNAQWQHKWSTAVGVGTRNTAREADRADRAEAEATALREALAQAEATLSALVVGTCPECGPVYRFDEDGCCTGCGHDVALGGQPPTGADVSRCPACGHAPHRPGACLNMASDHDCNCGQPPTGGQP